MNYYDILKHLDELFEEAIINFPDEEILEDLKQRPNSNFQKHLTHIKKLNTKAKATMQKRISNRAKEILDNLINEIGKNELLTKLLDQPKYQKLAPQLYSKFEEITEEDKESMLTDRKFMELVRELRKDLENDKNSE